MTAETVCHEIALSNHMKVTLEYDPDGSRTAILWNEANEPIADGDAPVLTAAPAVQPAAGREEIARAVYDWVRDDARVGLKMQMGPEIAAKLIDRLAALSQPGPASEGDGESVEGSDSDLLKSASPAEAGSDGQAASVLASRGALK